MKDLQEPTQPDFTDSLLLCTRLSDEKIEKISNFIDDVSGFMKRQKLSFTEKFYEGKDRSKMTFQEQRNLRDEYFSAWKEEESRLYKLVAGR